MTNGILIITDAWEPHTNGVITTIKHTVAQIAIKNLSVWVLHPGYFKHITLKEFDYAYRVSKLLLQFMTDYAPRYIHIATEGPLGFAARKICLEKGWKFTTAYHTKYPEYLKTRWGIPESIGYKYCRWFHAPAARIMAATYTLMNQLKFNHFYNDFGLWTRGVDSELFNPKHRTRQFSAPYALYVGRLSKEKNIEEFLEAKTDMLKVLVGDGPHRAKLQKKYPEAFFVGKKKGEQLARYFANATVFVFPSKTDTFGLVMIEALASGTPIACKPESATVVTSEVASIRDDLTAAIAEASKIDRNKCREFVEKNGFTWENATSQFINNLVPIN